MGNFILFQINGYSNPMNYYDLVSRGKNTSGSNQCYGTYDSSTGTGTGSGYSNSCVHSGTIANIDANTVWYNYTLASAGTITGTSNATTATQSICPKGWTLPSSTQANTIVPSSGSTAYVLSFSPVLGGYYRNSSLRAPTTDGYWWITEIQDSARRVFVNYYNGSMYIGYDDRTIGLYIRCVSSS